ncbi:hypothetical protein LGL08_20560 [Clostridium estertheticum]|uniref:hypothetical protein n=1 Tax=Clostridium estertheticum TaxID=238834 RepID=UPI001CF41BFF|nr:hypothetical protein [Clostridium estertheticum]MCB2308824.1 hypothetical protein [Clostridium estertheticum]MCB2347312.1 hypothetical protein [Clostridium estertheticum]MCB2351922.1 hypothetical protein [Clostridium estertheticum]WAG48511.1 hypothetical protein LL127_23240 [Clostridium estertheticum]
MSGVRQRRMLANYLEVGTLPAFVLMGAGFTELNESPSAQTASKRYINDKSSSQSIVGYEWSTPFTTDQIKAQEVIEFICNIGEKQLTGPDAEARYVMVNLDKLAAEATPNVFEARLMKVAIEVSDFGDEDGEMTAEGNLLGNGDIVLGTFSTETKTFTATI